MGFIGCKGSDKKTEEPKSALESAGDSITGEVITSDYVKLLCAKYEECEIKAFKDDTDCTNRIRAVLDQDAKWKEFEMNKKALKTCLNDFKGFACEEFKGGKSPESCRKL
jgi:hypothetical protein